MDRRRKKHIDKRMESLRLERKKKYKRCFIIFMELLTICGLSVATYGMFKYNKFDINVLDRDEIIVNDGVFKEGYTTVALFGGDSRDGKLEKGSHADTIMIASINNTTNAVNIASIYRDTLSLQENGDFAKINNAYYVGGPSGAINVLNLNYDLDIMNYVTVDFSALTQVIDLLGGVEIEVSSDEMIEMNNYINETAKISGIASTNISTPGMQLLDGVQAVTYARIRKNVGEDYARTSRQRELIEVILSKINILDFKTINNLVDTVFGQVSTNFTVYEILELASGINNYKINETTGYPLVFSEVTLAGVGSTILATTHLSNVSELHEILYPGEIYESSEMVREIDAYIQENLNLEN